MPRNKVGKLARGEVIQQHAHRNKVISPHTQNTGTHGFDDNALASLVGLSLGSSGLTRFIRQVFVEVVYDFFHDPRNAQVINEFVSEFSRQECLAHTKPTRDISNNEIIRPRDLPQATGLSKTQIWRLSKADQFVKKLKLSNGCVGFLRSDVEAWLASRQTI